MCEKGWGFTAKSAKSAKMSFFVLEERDQRGPKNPLQTDLVCRELRKPPARILKKDPAFASLARLAVKVLTAKSAKSAKNDVARGEEVEITRRGRGGRPAGSAPTGRVGDGKPCGYRTV